MSRQLRLSPDVSLPLDAVTQTFAVLGKRGSGKTNTASVLTEQLIKHGLPVVYVDPIGVTWGLRHSRDGKGPGLPVIILGGEHADVPLEEAAGHMSPFEHVAQAMTKEEWVQYGTEAAACWVDSRIPMGNLWGWRQYRKTLRNEHDFSKIGTDDA